ncbi:MAG TPA: F0F1 ATP synthase subunit B [Prolixibacteraceae bacterium]|nr:F0F1 ATP synthase subunit B [Prolixibacteraceae bacterium]
MFLIPHIGTIIWVTIIFLLVYFILAKFAWPTLIKILEDREETIASSLINAEKVKEKLIALEKTQEEIIKIAKIEKEQIVQEGIDQREKIITMANENAQRQTNRMIEDARKQIERERDMALTEMKNQIASLSIEIATKLVKTEMEDKKRHEQMVSKLIDEIELN